MDQREERGPRGERADRVEQDPTRKLLKVFGVKVTDYEAKTAELVARYPLAPEAEQAAIALEVAELTADLSHWLREVTGHVLQRQEDVLSKLT